MRHFGLIGFPVGHSRSADYFNSRFSREGLTDAHYRLFPMPALQELQNLLRTHPFLEGFNVTIPFKRKIMPMLTDIDPVAREIGSVNVVLIRKEGNVPRLIGYNTDAEAFLTTLDDVAGHRKALILGTGGAAGSVAWALEKAGIGFLFVSRTPHGLSEISYQALRESPEILQTHTLIINTSPAGMFPHTDTCPQIPFGFIGKDHFLYDLVYNPSPTLFLLKGDEKGARTKSGEDMFLKQADLSYALFTG